MKYKLLHEPLSLAEMKEQAGTKNAYIKGVVAVDLSDAIDNDLEGWLDLLSEKLTDSPLLMDTNYEVVGHQGDTLHLQVTGDASQVIECAEEK
jgi:hypothetical protein